MNEPGRPRIQEIRELVVLRYRPLKGLAFAGHYSLEALWGRSATMAYSSIRLLSLVLLGILGCRGRATEVRSEPTTATKDELGRVLAGAVNRPGILPPFSPWTVQTGVRAPYVRFATASFESPDEASFSVEVLDLEGAEVMTAAGDLEPPLLPEHDTTGFKAAPHPKQHRTVYRLNPPGGFFGGEIRIFVGDRFIVTAKGDRLTMETVSDKAWRVVRAVEAFAAGARGKG